MPLLIRAYPLHRNYETELTDFAGELASSRREEAHGFYAGLGVARETWALQRIAGEPWLIGVTQVEGDLHATAARFAAADDEFSRWFKQRVHALSSIDPNTEPLGPPSRVIFDWRPDRVSASANLAIAPEAAD
jgi:hypothetical protein